MDEKNPDNLYIISNKYSLSIKVRPNGYIPKSGLLLIESLNKFNFSGKSVIDIGCGETGIIAHYLSSRMATQVLGIDIDPIAINHVMNSSNISSQINWMLGDFCSLEINQFDIMVSNPPQMPMSDINRKKLNNYHDSPGKSGQEMILNILTKSIHHLNQNGSVFMIIFDFLGIKETYNSLPSIESVVSRYGFSCDIIDTYPSVIRCGGQTETNLPWIKHFYPKYNFIKDDTGNILYNTMVVKFQI